MFAEKPVLKYCIIIIVSLAGNSLFGQQKTLYEYLHAAYENSPLIKDYTNQILSNRIDNAVIAANYGFQVSGSSNNNYAPVIKGYGYEGAITNVGNFNELITASKQFIGGANLQNQYRAVRLANDSLRIAAGISKQDIQKSVTQQYISAYGDWLQYSFNNEVYYLLSKEDTILKKLTEATVYRQTDYLIFLVTLQQQKLSVKQAKIQLQNDYAQLNYLSGIFDTSFQGLAAPDLQIDSIVMADNTIFSEKFRIDSLILKNEQARIDFNYKPKLSIYGDAGFVSTLTYKTYKNLGTSFGVNLNIPIYDGGQRNLQHRKIDIAEQTRQNYRDFFKMQYNQQVAQLIQQYNSTQQLIEETNSHLKYVEGLIQANRKLLATGDVRIADYIIAINNYLNAKNAITQNTIAKLQIITQINYWNKR